MMELPQFFFEVSAQDLSLAKLSDDESTNNFISGADTLPLSGGLPVGLSFNWLDSRFST